MANRYAVGANGSSLLSTSSWSTTSGGSAGASVPATSDVGIFDTNSATSYAIGAGDSTTWYSINASDWAGTITIGTGGNLIIRQNVILNSNVTITGGTFQAGYSSTAGTWTLTGGVIIDCDMVFEGKGAKTMSGGNLTINGQWRMTGIQYVYGAGLSVYLKGGGATGSYYINDHANNPDFYLQGGTYSGYLPNVANCYIDGDVTWEPDVTPGTYLLNIRELTGLKYLSGTITHTDSTVYAVSMLSSSVWDLEGKSVFNRLRFASGTITLDSDLHVNHVGSASASITINGTGKLYISGDFGCYGNTTYSGTGTMVFDGTGTIYSTQLFPSLGGTSYTGTLNVNINTEINTTGTITIYVRDIYFGGSCTFTYVAGTLVTAGATLFTSDTYTFAGDISLGTVTVSVGGTLSFTGTNVTITSLANEGTVNFTNSPTITNLSIMRDATLNASNGLTATILNQASGSKLYAPTGKTLNITTILYSTGKYGSPAYIEANPATALDFKGGLTTTIASNGWKSFSSFDDNYTFSFAFDYVYTGLTGSTDISGLDGYLWIPSNYAYRFYFYVSPSNYFYFNHGMSDNGVKHRVVVSKVNGSKMNVWIDGVSIYVGYNTSANFTDDINFGRFSKKLEGDVLFFQSGVDQTWVNADYLKFTNNDRSSHLQYDNTEPNLVAGWHVDSFTVENVGLLLNYQGTRLNQTMAVANTTFVDASSSSVPIYNWKGNVTDCKNIQYLSGEDIGGSSPSGYVVV